MANYLIKELNNQKKQYIYYTQDTCFPAMMGQWRKGLEADARRAAMRGNDEIVDAGKLTNQRIHY